LVAGPIGLQRDGGRLRGELEVAVAERAVVGFAFEDDDFRERLTADLRTERHARHVAVARRHPVR
jgi:hypothetical protein